ncbi:hypothetical protein A1O3_07464 [Capronia epimyces CBS 606.96]|uniref:N-acetyltransferase domain-containing protein n=1 Tax=Capronia epimyces CBS 606.96 TaxID=1182542 RepID=W9YFU7_9EURO|nr:uncharacterized protein A1O3_07464 [Capronia epimyces CBS 606.96]EXJ81174.1 hypothetical protein A1O3_07464 [Capronia epimyces CBS 606.96]
MPQASLFSYFSKSLTSTSTTPEGDRGPKSKDYSPHEGDVSLRLDPVPPQAGLGILRQIHRQPTNEAATDSGQTDGTDTNLESQHTSRDVSDKPLDRLSFHHPTDASQIIPIPHLPGALITTIHKSHLQSIQRLTSTTLPVRYGEVFFTSTLSEPTSFQLSRVVLYSSEPVGWIRCRLEPCSPSHSVSPSKSELSQIYVQALALLSPYRGLGIATKLLDVVLQSSIAQAGSTVCIYAHVWEKNEDALEWYAKRGFKRVMLIERYYKRLRPGGAWILRKELDGR